jgi:amino acid permease
MINPENKSASWIGLNIGAMSTVFYIIGNIIANFFKDMSIISIAITLLFIWLGTVLGSNYIAKRAIVQKDLVNKYSFISTLPPFLYILVVGSLVEIFIGMGTSVSFSFFSGTVIVLTQLLIAIIVVVVTYITARYKLQKLAATPQSPAN